MKAGAGGARCLVRSRDAFTESHCDGCDAAYFDTVGADGGDLRSDSQAPELKSVGGEEQQQQQQEQQEQEQEQEQDADKVAVASDSQVAQVVADVSGLGVELDAGADGVKMMNFELKTMNYELK